eukprot:jgi/Tetstr1/421910/TSEL_012810.t1
MGGLLSQPVTTKESSSDENTCFLYGASAMQGWRPEMEDAHMHKLGLAGKEEAGLFGVFDGHGGQEVALFCAKHLLAQLQQTEAYQQGNFKQALHDVFLRLDEMVADKQRWPELKELAGQKSEENMMTMDEGDLPNYLNRALSAARQRQRELLGDEDEDEMEDEVGDPNFDPEFQDSEDLDSSEGRHSGDSDTEIPTPAYLKRQSLPDPTTGFQEEAVSGSDHEVGAEDFRRPGSRQLNMVAEGLHSIGVASPASGFSDGEYDYDYDDYDDNYSSDEFDSFEESGELSNSGKRLNSPCYRRPKSKEGKRARGSRPGSSDSRPHSAPTSRPTTVGSEDGAQPWSPHSKSAFGLPFSTSRLKPADVAGDSGGVASKDGDETRKAEHQQVKAPSAEEGRPETPPVEGAADEVEGIAELAACSIGKGSADGHAESDNQDPKAKLTPEHTGSLELEVQEGSKLEGSVKLDFKSAVKSEQPPSGNTSEDGSTAGAGTAGVDATAGQTGNEVDESNPLSASNKPASEAESGGEASDDSGPQEHETLDPEAPTAGCTAVVAMVFGRRLLVANAGDSRCVCSREGIAHAMTEDHKPGNPEELSRVLKAGGMVADGRIMGSLNLSRAIGDLEFKTAKGLGLEAQMVTPVPEIREIELAEGDEFLVLACDGIWDVLSNQEVVTFVRSALLAGNDPLAVCEQLCDRCCAKDTDSPEQGCDNLSCMVVLFKELWHG